MKITCPYCDTKFDDTLARCPHCGAASEGVVRTAATQPLTIQDLKKWYHDHGLPPYEKTRFFIGEDYKLPKAFGIYQDPNTRNFVVYKNLADGTRKVRYQGTDEAYAVNELYMRLKEEIIQQKNHIAKKNSSASSRSGFNTAVSRSSGSRPAQRNIDYGNKLPNYYREQENAYLKRTAYAPMTAAQKKGEHRAVFAVILVVFAIIFIVGAGCHRIAETPYAGYYHYNDTDYYHANLAMDKDDWYYYDTTTETWEHTYDDLPDELFYDSTAQDFYYTPTWDSETQENDFDVMKPFTVSPYADQYESHSSYSYDNDNSTSWTWDDDDDDYDWDWGNDDWDYGSTDWDSDW